MIDYTYKYIYKYKYNKRNYRKLEDNDNEGKTNDDEIIEYIDEIEKLDDAHPIAFDKNAEKQY